MKLIQKINLYFKKTIYNNNNDNNINLIPNKIINIFVIYFHEKTSYIIHLIPLSVFWPDNRIFFFSITKLFTGHIQIFFLFARVSSLFLQAIKKKRYSKNAARSLFLVFFHTDIPKSTFSTPRTSDSFSSDIFMLYQTFFWLRIILIRPGRSIRIHVHFMSRYGVICYMNSELLKNEKIRIILLFQFDSLIVRAFVEYIDSANIKF